MRFVIDRCAGRTLADWLRDKGHDVVDSRDQGPDPGDLGLLEFAHREGRILVTIDTDFGQLVFHQGLPHSGLIRLPDVPVKERVEIMADILNRFFAELEEHSIITVRSGRVRISRGAR